MPNYTRVASLKTADDFLAYLDKVGAALPFDRELTPDLFDQPISWSGGTIGNRFCILPMEGWDGTTDGRPTELTTRRWRNFGISGAKLLWGGEAVAVRQDGRANPNQLMINDQTLGDLEKLRAVAIDAHAERFGATDDLLLGLQLTHSGRFARPNDKKRLEPRIAYHHPVLDKRFGVQGDGPLLSDDDLDRLVDDFIAAAKLSQQIGFTFVDIKHCHGYLGHELLSGFDRPGRYGGDFENRTRLLRNVTAGIRAEAPGLAIGVRLSIFDFTPFEPGEENVGKPSAGSPYHHAFGGDGSALGIDLDEPSKFVDLLKELGIDLLCSTAGSPYYNPHIQRPAYFPPSDGYLPPEDPLVGVARQIAATAQLKAKHPETIVVGSGYSYLQDWLPNVAQAVLKSGMADSIGLGRMVLSYPNLPADVIAGEPLKRKSICRTFSDCTTAPRNGIVSGCYPLDPFYKEMPERAELNRLKKEQVPK
jgi:2,4-dienoyl-CoA reductase-like NADH-dependent reductase (Old Yellow Enzyme family)